VNKKHGKVIIALAVCAVLVIAFTTYYFIFVKDSSIDCAAIYEESNEYESKGIATNLTPEAIQKCYPD